MFIEFEDIPCSNTRLFASPLKRDSGIKLQPAESPPEKCVGARVVRDLLNGADQVQLLKGDLVVLVLSGY